ncbi:MAG: EamA family transporter [Candidatus Brocadiia bacterium]
MPVKVIVFLGIAILGWGIAAVIDKLALKQGEPLIGLTVRAAAILFMLITAIIINGKTKELVSFVQNDMRSVVLFSLSGLLSGFIAMLAYYAALQLAPASKVVPISSIYPLVTALLGIFLLKEYMSIIQMAGVLLVVAGVYLIQFKIN